ncbi:D-alanine--D-alanine ligase [Pseudoclavibacter endophyticus]|uniref:D-alanine--D-alanine ligase n=1 Tax=Pseudoclavibacter endophyticus TaxID=1778590 RepID=A0A6H9WEF6_9MICO|nr:D-alanine--D-alanine ligase family protein [Pseudoclavibacter endophyticus]KAB1649289.1 D-alanine--D-alanine ligase [Pseudoclavibacter endophyticus]GGA63824.1 D-alanine--D-alanine ligase [Pseudoclavibacter endophyticus]
MATNEQRTRVAVLFGGRSSEHTVSCATAGGVLTAIDRERFEVVPIGITRDGAWVLEEDDPAKFALNRAKLPEVVDNGTRVHLPSSALHHELTVSYLSGAPAQSTSRRPSSAETTATEARADLSTRRSLGVIDVVLPLLHGPFGEDGTLQGTLEMLDLPFVGSSVLASAVAMDKHYTKIVLRDAGLRVAGGFTVYDRDWGDGDDASAVRVRDRAASDIGFPLFVKPARAGSSVGVSKVESPETFDDAMRTAFAEDDHVLIEAGIDGREVEVAVLESRPGEPPRVSVAGEIVMTDIPFYDFAAKYLDAPGVELVCPAPLTEAELAEMQSISVRAFEALGCEGLARVDFFLGDDGFVINEVNTLPGFTPISMFPKCWEASGLTYSQLITELVEVALASAHARRSRRARLG